MEEHLPFVTLTSSLQIQPEFPSFSPRLFGIRMRHVCTIALAFLLGVGSSFAATLATDGKAQTVIVLDPAATAAEVHAAQTLASTLKEITGATFEIETNTAAPRHAIVVGQGQAAQKLFQDVPFSQLNGEEWIIRTRDERLLLAGGRPRGTLYAVSRFLQDQCGARWWTPWASRIPRHSSLRVPKLDVRAKPAFEYRAPYWFDAFDSEWSWKNLCDSQFSHLSAEQGGAIEYAGFVHTFYPLVPPDKYFAEHPEWYSLVNGHRTNTDAQLCTTNPKLRDFLVEQVRHRLRKTPGAGIISVSQNDCFGPCECADCKALDDAEGSHSGSLIALVNYIAERIAPEFPDVAVDTLAYLYTRKPPRTERPRPNVIVRLCSIECNFREPLDQPANAAFGDDLRGWAKCADRLYIWDYVTDFANYIQPHPNWFVLGPNLRFFQSNHVRGVFEEGAYHSHGAEMAEMRAWVLAQLMCNPRQDDRALIREFLDGYYGAAGRPIESYLELLHKASQGRDLTCYYSTNVSFLDFKTLAEAEKLWQQAEQAVAGDAELLARVRMGHLPLRYVWLVRWDALKKDCAAAGAAWPLHESLKEVAEEWRQVATGDPRRPWTKVTAMREGGLTPESFLAGIEARAE
jgi:hypothetical protein